MKFSLYFPEIDENFDGYPWKYILDHLNADLPLKFHGLFTEFGPQTPMPRKRNHKEAEAEKERPSNDQKSSKASTANDVAEDSDASEKPKGPSRKKKLNPYSKPVIRDSVGSECDEEPGDEDDCDDDENDEDLPKVDEPVIDNELLYRLDASGRSKDTLPTHNKQGISEFQ
jgi:hypothetical protein